MPILPRVGRKTLSLRVIVLGIYALLILGGVTMVGPFCITLTGAVSNEVDYYRYDLAPAYFWREDLRYAKYLAEKYANVRFEHFAVAHAAPAHWSEFRDLGHEKQLGQRYLFTLANKPTEQLARIAKDYETFMKDYDSANMLPLFSRWDELTIQRFLRGKYSRLVVQEAHQRKLTRRDRSAQALLKLSRTWNEGLFAFWDQVVFLQEVTYPYHLRRWAPPNEPRLRDFHEFLQALPAAKKIPITTRFLWCVFLLENGVQIDEIDKTCGTNFASLYRVPCGDLTELPPPLAALWQRFLDEGWPLRLTELAADAAAGFPDYVEHRYGTVQALNAELGTDFGTFQDVPTSRRLPEMTELRRLWMDYALTTTPKQRKRLSAEDAYRDFLARTYGNVEDLNTQYGWNLSAFGAAELPLREIDYYDYVSNKGAYLRRSVFHNFGRILRYIGVRGRALWNTLILVALTVTFTLTVNPLAAYALSRFRLRLTQQILVYLLATMAFPPEVAMIPSFLLLRDLHLLNTFAALVLPGMANGFSIFLLKGFFDSLPQELYESATLDGASEIRMFRSITLPLSTPILAVIALNAFIAAYGGFMWAFLVCQDQKMWTLMVWLYQFMQGLDTTPPMMMAAIVVSSVPTLLVFVFCQKIILRGIVIPSMK